MTRTRAADSPPVVLTIAGSDSGGGAGIQSDLKTIEACGGFGTSAITSVTAQHTRGVESTHLLPRGEIDAQIGAVFGDFAVDALKTGMLATGEIVDLVTDRVAEQPVPAVVDPVMVAASGDRLLERDAEEAYEALVAESTLVTPNADEAEILTGVEVTNAERAREAGERLLEMGANAALVKGGHVPGEEVVDVLVTDGGVERITHSRVETDATHGSGCMLSSAIATRLAHGDPLAVAVRSGVDLLARAVRYGLDVGQGPGSVHHVVEVRNEAAREPTAEAVEGVVEQFADADVSRLVPEVGMNVVGATPYAETPEECAAVEGRITRTLSGINPNRGVRFGASSHVARFLLASREFDPDLRFAVNCRYDDTIQQALDDLDGPVAEYDRAAEPEPVKAEEGSTMQWGARQAFEAAGETPVAVADPGDLGKEAIVKLLAPDAETLADRTLELLDAVEGLSQCTMNRSPTVSKTCNHD